MPPASTVRALAEWPDAVPAEGSGPVARPLAERMAGAILAGMIGAYVAVYVSLCAIKYRYYLYTDFDLAIFAQALDRVLAGSLFNSVRGMNWLGDHASLILFPIAPLYAIGRHPFSLLVIQTVALALGAVAVHRLARRELHDERPALAFAFAYLAYPALGYTNLFEFHPETLATTTLLFTFLHVRRGRLAPALLFGFASLLCREDVALVLLPLGVYATWLHRRSSIRLGLWLVALSVVSLVASFGILMPAFNGGEAEHALRYPDWGGDLREIAFHVAADPLRALVALFSSSGAALDHAAKREYWLHMLMPLAFLPLLAPALLAMALPVLLEHFLSGRTQEHTIVYQYTALVTPCFIAAAVLGAKRALGWGVVPVLRRGQQGDRPASLALVLLATGLAGAFLFGPLGIGWLRSVGPPESNLPSPHDRALAFHRDRMVARVPARGAVVAGFEFLPRLSGRDSLHSVHHVVAGRYTMSSRPYPIPRGVAALLVDLGPTGTARAPDLAGVARLAALVEENGLAPVDDADGLVLFLRNPPDARALWTRRPLAPADRIVSYDGQLALGDAVVEEGSVRAGGTLPVRLTWQRVAPIDRSFVMSLEWYDGKGRKVHARERYVGYGISSPAAWPLAAAIEERSHVVVPAHLAPGTYGLGLRLGWKDGFQTGPCRSSDASIENRGGLLPLGTVRVVGAGDVRGVLRSRG